jgi:hypothetical protein
MLLAADAMHNEARSALYNGLVDVAAVEDNGLVRAAVTEVVKLRRVG